MEITRDNLDSVSLELNKVLDLDPPIDTGPKIKDKILIEDITDVFNFNLNKDDKLSKETETILFDMGLIRKEYFNDIKKDPEKVPEYPEKIIKKKSKQNTKRFVMDGFKDGTFIDLKNKKIAEIVRERFNSKTSPGTIAVYRCNFNKLNKEGE